MIDLSKESGDDSENSKKMSVNNPVEKPKQPPTAFVMFMADYRQDLEKLSIKPNEMITIAKLGGAKWREMTPEDKQPYLELHKKARLQYEESMKEYHKRMNEAEKNEEVENSKMVDESEKSDEVESSEKMKKEADSDSDSISEVPKCSLKEKKGKDKVFAEIDLSEESDDEKSPEEMDQTEEKSNEQKSSRKVNYKEESDSDYEITEVKISKRERERKVREKNIRKVKKKEESDSDYENESSSQEDSDDPDFEVEVKGQKRSRKEKKEKEKKEKEKKNSKKPVMSSYEKMIEEKKAERLAFLQSLKMDDIKADISESMNSMKRKYTRKKKETPAGPIRKSGRSANVVNYSEQNMIREAVQITEPVKDESLPLPPEMSFSEALLSGEFHEKFVEDFSNIQNQKSEGNKLFYDKFLLVNMTLDEKNITSGLRQLGIKTATSLAWHPSSELILAAGYTRGEIRIWNVESNSGPYSFKIHNVRTSHLQFNPFNPVELFSSSTEGTLRVGDMKTQMFTEVYENYGAGCTYFDFVSPTTYLLSLTDGTVAILDKRLKKKLLHKHHQCHDEPIVSVDVHPMNENIFLTADKNGLLKLWDLRKLEGRPAASLKYDLKSVNSALFSPVTGNMILASSYQQLSVIYSRHLELGINMKKSKMIHSKAKFMPDFSASWLPNSDELFSFGCRQQYPSRICVYTKDLKFYHDLISHNLNSFVNYTAFHPFRPAVAGGNTSGKICVFT